MTIDQLQAQGHDVQPAASAAPRTPAPKSAGDNFNPIGMTLEQLQAQGHEIKPAGAAPDQDTEAPPPEGMLATAARRLATSAVPTVGGIEAGTAAAAASLPFAPLAGLAAPAVPIAAGILGGLGAGYVLDRAQSAVLKALGLDQDAQLAS